MKNSPKKLRNNINGSDHSLVNPPSQIELASNASIKSGSGAKKEQISGMKNLKIP